MSPPRHPLAKVFGERHSGTNFAAALLAANFDVALVGFEESYTAAERRLLEAAGYPMTGLTPVLERIQDANHARHLARDGGWKHAALDDGLFAAYRDAGRTFFLCTLRHPALWLRAMWGRAFHDHLRRADGRDPEGRESLGAFLRRVWVTRARDNLADPVLASPALLWKHKAASYLAQAAKRENVMVVRHEDILRDPGAVLARIDGHLTPRGGGLAGARGGRTAVACGRAGVLRPPRCPAGRPVHGAGRPQMRRICAISSARTCFARPAMPDAAPRAWQRMLSGRRLDLLDPSPLDVEIEDIAHGLARVARWNGQTKGDWPFSVAQHSLVVEDIFGRYRPKATVAERLYALIHDAPEYVIGDMISPFKAALGLDYKAFEHRLAAAVHIRFGLAPEPGAALEKAIKRADRASAYFEATQLAGFSVSEATKFFGRPRFEGAHAMKLVPAPTAAVEEAFLARFQVLMSRT